MIFGLILLAIIICVVISCVKVVRQAQALVIERLGAYQATWGTGLHFKIPIFDRVARRVDLKEQVVDFAPQPVITKDNVTMRIDTVVFYQITDPKMFCYGVANPIMAIENLTATTLRNIIGDLELDQTLTSRETINTKMRASLDVATDPWGIKVNRVELKNIIPPAAIQDAMEKQMKAERERREAILRAEGEDATGGRKRESVTSDAMEALIGAIYLDGGFANAKEFIHRFILKDLENKKLFFDSKTILQEIVQANFKEVISYHLIGEEGPDHNKTFRVAVHIGEEEYGVGEGRTKKAAEQEAAYISILKLHEKNIK